MGMLAVGQKSLLKYCLTALKGNFIKTAGIFSAFNYGKIKVLVYIFCVSCWFMGGYVCGRVCLKLPPNHHPPTLSTSYPHHTPKSNTWLQIKNILPKCHKNCHFDIFPHPRKYSPSKQRSHNPYQHTTHPYIVQPTPLNGRLIAFWPFTTRPFLLTWNFRFIIKKYICIY